jgi:transcriptional regulator
MHPDRRFEWEDDVEMRAFLDAHAFSTIVSSDAGGMVAAYAPIVVQDPRAIRFHLSRNNRAVPRFDGARALLSCIGPHGYVSPDWYGTDHQVPTWNYVAVECEGVLRRLDDADTTDLIDRLGDLHEAALLPKPVWTKAKMRDGDYQALLRGVAGFEMQVESIRGTRKLGQHKNAAEREGAAAGMTTTGRDALARAMRAA